MKRKTLLLLEVHDKLMELLNVREMANFAEHPILSQNGTYKVLTQDEKEEVEYEIEFAVRKLKETVNA